MTFIKVLIATTGGPVAIERVTAERAPQSMVCLKRTSQVLPISGAYDDFVRAGSGVITREFGGESYRLDLSDAIGSGESWQLGAYLAHALQQSQTAKLAGPDDHADQVVWASGRVNYDLEVEPVDHIAEKIAAAQHLFEGDSPALVILPAGENAETAKGLLPDSVTVHGVTGVREALALLDVPTSAPAPYAPDGDLDDEELPSPPLFKILGLIAIVGVMAWVYWDDKAATQRALNPEKPNPVSESAPKPVPKSVTEPASPPKVTAPKTPGPDLGSLKLMGRYAPEGGRCAAVHFGTIAPDIRVYDPAGPKPCGFQAVVTLADGARYAGLHLGMRSGRLIEAEAFPNALDGHTPTSGQITFNLDVPLRQRAEIKADLTAVFGEKPVASALAALRHGGDLSAFKGDAIEFSGVSLHLKP